MAVRKVRRAVREKRISLKVFERDKRAFQEKAEEEGLSLSSWMVHTCKQHVQTARKMRPSSTAPIHEVGHALTGE